MDLRMFFNLDTNYQVDRIQKIYPQINAYQKDVVYPEGHIFPHISKMLLESEETREIFSRQNFPARQ